MKSIFLIAMLAILLVVSTNAYTDSVGYYFNVSNELIDLSYPGSLFYGEVVLNSASATNLIMDVNPFSAPAEVDYLGNIIGSPTLAGPNFGIQKFAFDSTLIITENDFNTFLALYDIVVPNNWGCDFNGQVSEIR